MLIVLSGTAVYQCSVNCFHKLWISKNKIQAVELLRNVEENARRVGIRNKILRRELKFTCC